MLQMGDEAHNRNRAGTLMLLRDLAPAMATSGATPPTSWARSLRFIGGNDHFFLNLAMPACKLALDAARDIDGSTMVVAMARNGTDFGIQVSGTGDEWFTGPAQVAEGLFLGDYGPDDANPDIGDSAITETAGIGGFAMATAPAIVRLVGGTVPDALATDAAHARDHPGREPPLDRARARLPGRPERHRRRPASAGPGSCRRSTPGWPAVGPASARSGPGWSPLRRRSSRRRWRPSPRACRADVVPPTDGRGWAHAPRPDRHRDRRPGDAHPGRSSASPPRWASGGTRC